ncbi:spore cortex-lytic protein [Leptolyngbya sp. Heron Island J]|nr:spore cortex-lytic protein [Leptolyngbya sp. Heron Island J]
MATVGLAKPDHSSLEPKEQLNTTSKVLIAQAEEVLIAQAEEVLGLGSTGDAVKSLQAMLALMGYYSGEVDGAYEQMTLEAVRQFQTDAGLMADGVVGPLTWQRLLPTPTTLTQAQEPQTSSSSEQPNSTPALDSDVSSSSSSEPAADDAIAATAGNLPILKLDDSGADVSRLQTRLADLNLYTGPVDGVFGEQTQQAVEQFQSQSGLSVDGIVGPATWLALFD